MTNLIEDTKSSIAYLESVEILLQQANLSEIDELREELIETGYLKRRHRADHYRLRWVALTSVPSTSFMRAGA